MGGLLRGALGGPGGNEHRPFELGEVVCGRFRIVREVGRGGMGVVYEALDRKLDRRIAIKCARLGFRSRLPPEARAARELSHFNVSKLHALHTAETPSGDANFLPIHLPSPAPRAGRGGCSATAGWASAGAPKGARGGSGSREERPTTWRPSCSWESKQASPRIFMRWVSCST